MSSPKRKIGRALAHVKFFGIVAEARPVDDEANNTGTPKSPIGFLGKRKHNIAMSFSARKTISGVCADEA